MTNKLPKEKRNKVILVWLFTLMVAAAWGFGLLSWQLDAKRNAAENLEKGERQFVSMTNTLNNADKIQDDMATAEAMVGKLEAQMANGGDIFNWVVNTVRDFKGAYQVDLPQFSQPTPKSACTLLPKFPYQQTSVTVAGSAYYQDLGMFIADFENHFRFARINNLSIEPASALGADNTDREKLNFKMDIIFLVKPN